MKALQPIQSLSNKIDQVKAQLLAVGEMRPGSLSRQYNVCGKAGCRCKHPTQPQRHGPYYKLSYVHQGKFTTQFIRQETLAQVRQELANYKRFRKLTARWIDLALQLAKWKLKHLP